MRNRFTLLFITVCLIFVAYISFAQTAPAESSSPDVDALLGDASGQPAFFDASNPSGKVMLSTILLVVGALLKKSPVKDWMIPFLILASGALLSGLIDGFTRVVIVRGIYCGCGAIAGHQLIKQLAVDRKDAAPQTATS